MNNIDNENFEQQKLDFTCEIKEKKKSRKLNNLVQLMAVSLISSIIGGSVVGSYFYFNQSTNDKKQTFAISKPSQTISGVQRLSTEQSAGDDLVTSVAEKVGPSIVGIKVTVTQQNLYRNGFSGFFFDFPNNSNVPDSKQEGEGSGIIIRSDGYIMTNNHVIESAINSSTGKLLSNAKIEVFLPTRTDKPYSAEIVGHDALTDLAVIKIDITDLPVAELGDSDKVKVGNVAIAIGNPGGLEYMGSVTSGIISGLNRTVKGDNNNQGFKLIQTDAAINPGNSGGALVNSSGQVIGINSVKVVAQGFEGLGFAIPINKAKEIIDSLIQYKYVKGRVQLGISVDGRYTESVAHQNNMPVGVYVANVVMLSGAYKAGIKTGDIITKFDGSPVQNIDDINNLKNKHSVGDIVSVEIFRDGSTLTLNVTLTENKG